MTKAERIFRRTLGCIYSHQKESDNINSVSIQTEGESISKRTLNDMRDITNRYFRLRKNADAYRIMMNSIDQYEKEMNEYNALLNS